MRVRAWLLAVVAVIAVVSAGCTSRLSTAIEMDRKGVGTVTLTLVLDAEALQTLGLSAADRDGVALRLVPALADGGWRAPDGAGEVFQNVIRISDDGEGGISARTQKPFDNVAGLTAIINTRRDFRAVAGDQAGSLMGSLPDLPANAPLINEFTFRLGDGTGDNPGFRFFGRGGVGALSQETCRGDRLSGLSAVARNGVSFEYRLRVPGGPGDTVNVDQFVGNESVWQLQYGDCDDLQANAGGGRSSTLFNGVVLAALSGLILMIFLVRGVRRRRTTSGLKG